MNVKLLKSKMVLCGDEEFVAAISKILSVSRQTASAKLNGEREFTQTEIALISKHYCLTGDEIQKIFIDGEDNDKERIH